MPESGAPIEIDSMRAARERAGFHHRPELGSVLICLVYTGDSKVFVHTVAGVYRLELPNENNLARAQGFRQKMSVCGG